MKIGVIGFGSIGRRHVLNLLKLGCKDIVLLRTKNKNNEFGIIEVYSEEDFIKKDFDFIIVANPTFRHFYFIKKYLKYNKNLFVEKPPVFLQSEVEELKKCLSDYSGFSICAFNMRFHKAVQQVKVLLEEEILGIIYSARFFVGQYLPDWRPNMDYRLSYSANEQMGGGVILDLIHEIDLAQLFFGKPVDKFHSIVDKISPLEISSEDIAEIHYKSSKGVVVSIHLDYLTQGYSRYFEIIGEKGRIYCDLYKPLITITGKNNEIYKTLEFLNFEKDDMYIELMKYYISCLKDKVSPSPSLLEALDPMNSALRAKQFWRVNG